MATCTETKQERKKNYEEDGKANAAVAAANSGALVLLELLKGYAATIGSTYISSAINSAVATSGVGNLASSVATTMAMTMTIGPQMHLALFAVCVDVIKRQAQKRVAVATDTKLLLDTILAIYAELLLFPSIKSKLNDRIIKASRKVKTANSLIRQVIDVQNATEGGVFQKTKYSSAIDNVGSAVDYLNGGTGKVRPQTTPNTATDLLTNEPTKSEGNAFSPKNILDEETARWTRLWKKLQGYGQTSVMAITGVFYRTDPTLELLALIKPLLVTYKRLVSNTFTGNWEYVSAGGKQIPVEPLGSAGLVSLSGGITASIDGIEWIDALLYGDGNKAGAVNELKSIVLTFLLKTNNQLKEIYTEMDDAVTRKDDAKKFGEIALWSGQLQGIWEVGQNGGPLGAVSDDLAQLQSSLESYKNLRDYLYSDIDWGRNYSTVSGLVAKNMNSILKIAVSPKNLKDDEGFIKPYKALIQIRDIIVKGIKEDNELISEINKFDTNIPLIVEARKLLSKLEKLGGGYGDALASGDMAKYMKYTAASLGAAGLAFPNENTNSDEECSGTLPILGDPSAESSKEEADQGAQEAIKSASFALDTTLNSEPVSDDNRKSAEAKKQAAAEEYESAQNSSLPSPPI